MKPYKKKSDIKKKEVPEFFKGYRVGYLRVKHAMDHDYSILESEIPWRNADFNRGIPVGIEAGIKRFCPDGIAPTMSKWRKDKITDKTKSNNAEAFKVASIHAF